MGFLPVKYRHRLTLHRRTRTANDFQADEQQSEKVAEVFASLEPVGGTENEAAAQQRGLERYKIMTRWGPTLAECDSSWWATREHPVTKREERFEFTSVRNVGERNREFEIEAVRRG